MTVLSRIYGARCAEAQNPRLTTYSVGGANAGLAARMLEFGRTSEPWEAFAEEVKSIDPDVIALQEVRECQH